MTKETRYKKIKNLKFEEFIEWVKTISGSLCVFGLESSCDYNCDECIKRYLKKDIKTIPVIKPWDIED